MSDTASQRVIDVATTVGNLSLTHTNPALDCFLTLAIKLDRSEPFRGDYGGSDWVRARRDLCSGPGAVVAFYRDIFGMRVTKQSWRAGIVFSERGP